MQQDQERLRKLQQQHRQQQEQSSAWSFVPFETLIIFGLMGLLAWLVTRVARPITTTAAADEGVLSDIVNAVNGRNPKRKWITYLLYAVYAVIALLLFYALVRFALPHLFQETINVAKVFDDAVEKERTEYEVLEDFAKDLAERKGADIKIVMLKGNPIEKDIKNATKQIVYRLDRDRMVLKRIGVVKREG